MATGRFAPSPTGQLHVGNLRTALAAWLFARSAGSGFLVRMEDLDRAQSSWAHEASQLADLAAIGIDWDGPAVRQSDRFDRYEAAIAQLAAAGRTYRCYCTRREIQEAPTAPHAPPGAYPGTCRHLSTAARSQRERSGRPPALRLDARGVTVAIDDAVLGRVEVVVDDLVLRRNDGVPAYNLAVVVDDAAQGVQEVVRADDLATSAPRQRHLATLLGLPAVRYAHIPLVVGPDGRRLAKRDGAVTLADQARFGRTPSSVAAALLESLGQLASGDDPLSTAVQAFDLGKVPRRPVDRAEIGVTSTVE